MLTPLAPPNVELTSNKNQPGGYAGLDVNGDLTGIVIARTITNANVAATVFQPGEFVYVTDLKQGGIGNSTMAGDLIRLQSLPVSVAAPPNNLTTEYDGLWVAPSKSIGDVGLWYVLSWGNDALGSFFDHYPLSLVWDNTNLTLSIGDPTDPYGEVNQLCGLRIGGNISCQNFTYRGQLNGTSVTWGGSHATGVLSTNQTGLAPGNYVVDASGGNRTITITYATFPTGQWNIKKIDSSANTVTISETSGKTIDGAATKVLTAQYQHVLLWARNNVINIMG